MKICIAQIASSKSDIQKNIDKHFSFIQLAIENKADMIFFPELSLTGYHPSLAKEFTDNANRPYFDLFQGVSDNHDISIGIGLPTSALDGINISMIVFRPNKKNVLYSKEILHSDELPYFVEGKNKDLIEVKGTKIALGICYETLQTEHIECAIKNKAEIYLASSAKSQSGIEKAENHFSKMSREFKIPILLSNTVGPGEDFIGAGQSAVWDSQGIKLAQLSKNREGIIIYDTEHNSAVEK